MWPFKKHDSSHAPEYKPYEPIVDKDKDKDLFLCNKKHPKWIKVGPHVVYVCGHYDYKESECGAFRRAQLRPIPAVPALGKCHGSRLIR